MHDDREEEVANAGSYQCAKTFLRLQKDGELCEEKWHEHKKRGDKESSTDQSKNITDKPQADFTSVEV